MYAFSAPLQDKETSEALMDNSMHFEPLALTWS